MNKVRILLLLTAFICLAACEDAVRAPSIYDVSDVGDVSDAGPTDASDCEDGGGGEIDIGVDVDASSDVGYSDVRDADASDSSEDTSRSPQDGGGDEGRERDADELDAGVEGCDVLPNHKAKGDPRGKPKGKAKGHCKNRD